MARPLITVTIAGPQGSGKSRLEKLILDELLNQGAEAFNSTFSTVTGEETQTCRHFGADISITTTQRRLA